MQFIYSNFSKNASKVSQLICITLDAFIEWKSIEKAIVKFSYSKPFILT